MPRFRYSPPFLAGALLLLTGAAGADAGLRSAGDLLYSTRLGYIYATQRWDQDRALVDVGCRSQYSSSSHGLEYGHSYYYTLYGHASLAQSDCGANSKSGLSNLKAGVRGRINLYDNMSSWEVEATIPTYRGQDPNRVGCGQWGLAGIASKKFPLGQEWEADTAASVQLWESPLLHQFRAQAGLGRSFGRYSPWQWGVGLQGAVPLEGGGGTAGVISDCGTEARFLRATVDVSYRYDDFWYGGCGVMQTFWGEDVNRTRGFSCGISRLWKD